MTGKPISVIMSIYREDPVHLRQAVESIFNQTFSDFEFIIIADDPQNMGLIKIIEEYQQKDSRIRFYINDENIGAAHSRNRAILMSQGEYVAIMDADDVCDPERLSEQKAYFDNNKETDIVFTGRRDIDENGDVTVPFKSRGFQDSNIKNMLKYCDIITNPTVMIKAQSIKRAEGFRALECAEDYDLWLRCISMGFEFHYIDKPLLNYRIRNDSLSRKNYAKTWVATKYAKKLFKQREKSGNDTYSLENFSNYVKHSLAGSSKSTDRFNSAYNVYSVALDKKNNGNVLGAIVGMMHSILIHPEILKVFIDSALLKRCENKQS